MVDVTLTDLQKRYGNGHHAVRGITLGIRDQEFMVLVGPSGCGKTSTLRMIAGLEDITSGEIRIGPRRVNEIEPRDRDIAMVFQNYALYPHMTVFENMGYALSLRRRPRSEILKQVQETATLLGLQDQLGKKPKELSGGQRQRVALGRAIVRKPQLFLFDEPLSNLDAQLRSEMRVELKTLQNRLRTTAVYVTHDQAEAMTLGDRITVMSEGVIQQVATPLEIYTNPINRFVAAFIGSPMMNFIGGVLRRDDGELSLLPHGMQAPIPLRMPSQDQLASRLDGSVILGIRPEHITPAQEASGLPALDCTVRLVEQMGDAQHVHLGISGSEHLLIMKCGSRLPCRTGGRIQVSCDTLHGHVFADDTPTAPNLTLPVHELPHLA